MPDDEHAAASPRPPPAFALALEQLCSALDETVSATLGRLDSRLEASETAVRRVQARQGQRLGALAESARREREELDAQLRHERQQRQREAAERREEKQWLAELWPDGVPLPTLLQPFAPGASHDDADAKVRDVKDADARRRLEALVARRVARERVLRRLEEAKQWTLVVGARPAAGPEKEGEGEEEDAKPYYVNAETGESTWDAPVALLFEPPEGWDAARMDWRADYPLDNFYPKASDEDAPEDDGEGGEDEEAGGSGAGDGTDDDADDDAKELDPVECRREMEAALAAHEQLSAQLELSRTRQRALALRLLNATREAFEREKEALQQEDAIVKDAERKRRQAAEREQAAARAKEAAAERRRLEAQNSGQAQATLARASVVSKGLTLARDDDALEKELEAFAAAQRADRPYLTAPLAVDPRVREHRERDPEFEHVKLLEHETQRMEQLEFDLLEKTALRHEEAAAKSDEVRALAESIREQQAAVAQELPAVERSVERLEAPLAAPEDRRPTADELERAKKRFITPEPLEADDEASDVADESRADGGADVRKGSEELAGTPTPEPGEQRVAEDEDELRELKRLVDVERRWRLWEAEELMRRQELADARERRASLESTGRGLALDLALCEADEAVFSRLRDLEKAANARMWAAQADAQVERVRFMVERAAREESVYQVRDRQRELQLELVEAQRLPLRALNAVERLELERASAERVRELESKAAALGERLAEEEAAKTRLLVLERRASRYMEQRLQEEAALFADKQALWDANARLVDELQAERQVIARLYALVAGEAAPPLADEASRAFELKLQLQQQTRQFLLASYEREARWRALAAGALVPDRSSGEWMTTAQRERHERVLALLQEQHEERVAGLERELSLRSKVEAQLREHAARLAARLERVRRAYQASDEAVRGETRAVLEELQRELAERREQLQDEQRRHRAERERLVANHEGARRELEQRLGRAEQALEAQRHWLTAAKRELAAQRVANEQLRKAAQALERRRAAEVNDLRFRVAAQAARLNALEMWALALRLQAKEAAAERARMARELAAQAEQHRQLQRRLRLRVWRQRAAAQAVLSDVDRLFAFFADGLELLAGASRASNDALRANAGVRVLAALAAHSSQPRVRLLSARALGRVAWDANASARALGWRAKRTWLAWVRTQSDAALAALSAQQLAFDAEPSEESAAANWLDDPPPLEEEEPAPGRKKLRFVRSWLRVDDRERPRENAANQEHIGLTPGVLETIVDLCRGEPGEGGLELQRNALESLALVAMNTRNTALVGRMEGVIPLLVQLLQPPSEGGVGAPGCGRLTAWEVVRCAARALGNLAFESRHNQQLACAAADGAAVRLLLRYCDPDAARVDADLALASVQALASLVGDCAPACERVLAAGGVAALTRLCRSPLVHDAVEPDAGEAIQAHAALVLSTVVARLDEDDEGGEGGGRGALAVADAVLREEQRSEGGVAALVLLCASCNRDVALHGALVLGSLARHDAMRAAIGAAGGVDALFLLASAAPDAADAGDGRAVDRELLAQAAWALANLTWSRDNQYRVARYLSVLLRLCDGSKRASGSNQEAVEAPGGDAREADEHDRALRAAAHEHALCVLANALFYNEANRRLVAADARWLALLERECLGGRGAALEHAARALCALSYSDELALAMGACRLPPADSNDSSSSNNATDESQEQGQGQGQEQRPCKEALPFNGLALLVRLCGREAAPEVQRLALCALVNLVLHDANKPRLLRVPRGVETLVNLSAHASAAVRAPALEALELLADVRQAAGPPTRLAPSAGAVGGRSVEDLRRLAALLSDPRSSAAVVAMASDAVADEAWRRPSAQARLRTCGALEALLRRCSCAPDEPLRAPSAAALASSLWALRNVVGGSARNQDCAGALGGVGALVRLLERPPADAPPADVAEAALAALVALVLQHARNSRELVREGLDALLALAGRNEDGDKEEGGEDARSETAALARELLRLVAPYNAPLLPPLEQAASPSKSPSKAEMRQRQQLAQTTATLPALGGRR